MLSWVKERLNKNGSRLFVEVTDKSREKLNDACKLLQQLFPEDESAADQVMAILTDIPEKDKKVFLYKVNWNIRTILEEAIMVNNVKVIKKLLERFPYDLNNIKYNNKVPLHLACLYGRCEIVKVFIEHGASLTLVSGNINISAMKNNYATAKEFNKIDSEHKGTPLWYTFVMDNVEVLQTLYGFDIVRHYSYKTMMTEAIGCKASKCTRFILQNTMQQVQCQLACNTLADASRKSLSLVHVLLDAGATYDEDFFKRNPDLLLHYYGKVGMQDSGLESTCTPFTQLVMSEFDGIKHIQNGVNAQLVAKLLERTRKKVRLLKSEEIEAFYEDILNCLDFLVTLKPELPKEVPEAVEIALNCITNKYRFGPPNESEILYLIRLVQLLIDLGFDPHGGFCCPLLLAVKIPKFLFCLNLTSCMPNYLRDYLQLVECFLENGCNPNRVGSYGSPVLHRLIDHLSQGNSHGQSVSEIKNETFTKLVDMFCKYGLDPNVEIKYSSPANSHSDTVVRTTYLQLLVNKLNSVNYNRENGFTNARDWLIRIAIFAGQLVYISKELQHGDFKSAVTSLAQSFVKGTSSNVRHNVNYQRQSISPISRAVSKVFAFILSMMTTEERQQCLMWFEEECKICFPLLPTAANIDPDNPRVCVEDMEEMLREDGVCIVKPISLQDACALVIRENIFMQRTNAINSETGANNCCSNSTKHVEVAKESRSGVTARLETNPLKEKTDKDNEEVKSEREKAFDKMREDGFYLGHSLYLACAEQLPLPQALKDYIALKNQLEYLLLDIWHIFESRPYDDDI